MPNHEVDSSPAEPSGDQAAEDRGNAPDGAAEPKLTGEVADGPAESVSRAEFDKLKAERDQLVDRLARLQAEFENARKRAERERLEFRDYATGTVVEQFLPVLDNFELALKSTAPPRNCVTAWNSS